MLGSEHRDANGNLSIPELVRLKCNSALQVYEPLPEYRVHCPRILVICQKEHTHPIPLLTKTPPSIRRKIIELCTSLQQDLADLTPRRLLCHATTDRFLREMLPDIKDPAMIDLHPSLGNKDHLRSFIVKAQELYFPHGTGWEGNP